MAWLYMIMIWINRCGDASCCVASPKRRLPHEAETSDLLDSASVLLPFACSHNYVRGSITIYIINLHRSRKKIKLAGTLRNNTVHQYLLQPYGADGLRARWAPRSGRGGPLIFSLSIRSVFTSPPPTLWEPGRKGAGGANQNDPPCIYFSLFPHITSFLNSGPSKENGMKWKDNLFRFVSLRNILPLDGTMCSVFFFLGHFSIKLICRLTRS